MDLSQTKLSKTEWSSIETPITDDEKKVLSLIMDGYSNVHIRMNTNQSILAHLKLDYSNEMEYYLFKTQFEQVIHEMITPKTPTKKTTLLQPLPKYTVPITEWLQSIKKIKTKSPNSKDMIRIQNTSNTISTNKHAIFEFVLLDFVKGLVYPSSDVEIEKNGFFAYSLIQFKKSSIHKQNKYVSDLVDLVLGVYGPTHPSSICNVFYNAHNVIEKNQYLIKYEDMTLYMHQEKLFKIFGDRNKRHVPKLVMYMAPTGTGKTLSPIGLSQGYKIIFVCVARHVGLALAKSAISVNKRVAFAFGCETASDIRLHYFSAVDYKINKRSGGIGKVDNSNGTKVEIMICDVASYLTAMHYMLAFNNEQDIVTYWDEPTITMDYDNHELHAIIHENWKSNKISKVVLSCATLPKPSEITQVIDGFIHKFTMNWEEEVVVPHLHIIDSYDCKKSISLLNKDGKAMLPHLLFKEYSELLKCIRHVNDNKTLLRYFDVEEIVNFVKYVCEHGFVDKSLEVQHAFSSIEQINMRTLKNYYLDFLSNIQFENWNQIYNHFTNNTHSKLYLKKEQTQTNLRKVQSMESAKSVVEMPMNELRRINSVAVLTKPNQLYTSGILVSTSDAYTLTDGPTIFLAEDVDKIGLFYVQQAKIPENILTGVMAKIEKNNEVQRAISILQKEIDDKMASSNGGGNTSEKTKKAERDPALNKEVSRLNDRLDALKMQIENVSLNPKYVPNTQMHLDTWIPPGYEIPTNSFVPNIDQEDVKEIMSLEVDNQKKLLLIMGIGVFDMNLNIQYIEKMKQLAQNKKLFLIIATSDYIYGTNYQFSHGFIGKDLENMTQQKIIQAIGRIGRNNIQQDYTVRFRDNGILERLFKPISINKEAEIMCRLFCDE